ncbi:MAG: hypothetical protein IJS39_09355 [Synergistaceae bacterium]|nr:hypothetical protein [Synergistaceae bacterium]
MNNNQAWEKLFSKYDILSAVERNGYFTISADQIREYREPRLMTKFDHKINLPSVFLKNELAILPVTRGDYVISHFDAYHTLEADNVQTYTFSPPENIQSLDYNNVFSETVALNCAFAAGIIRDFLDEDVIFPTVSGRMGTGVFDFSISDTRHNTLHSLRVSNAQMEIDAAYEGRSCLAILEAKREISEDFITRQLYYPFRVWQNRITKPVRPVFFVYSNNVFSLYEYAFSNTHSYSSIKLIQHKNYSVQDTAITSQDIQSILQRVRIADEPSGIPFPQADTFERVINLCELLRDNPLTKQQITELYAFNERQADYYANAGRYLGLIGKSSASLYSLSTSGRKILSMNWKNRQLALCELILSHRAFHESMTLYFSTGHLPETRDITDIITRSDLQKPITGDTLSRRAKTLRSWLNWITSLITE